MCFLCYVELILCIMFMVVVGQGDLCCIGKDY